MEKEKRKKRNKEGWMTSGKERISYYMGLGGSRLMQGLASSNLATYMMFLGIDIRLIGGLMLGVRILDAVNDLLFGWICDRLHFKQNTWLGKGRFMPWIKIGAVLLPVSTLLLYNIPLSLDNYGKVIWLVVTYILWDLSFTVSDVPNTAIAMTMTTNYEERDAIMNTRYAIPMIIVFPISFLNTFLISEKVGMSLSMSITIMVLIYTAFIIPELFFVKERHLTEENTTDEKDSGESYTFKEMFHFLKTCKEIRSVLFSKFLVNASVSQIGVFVSFYLLGSSLYSMVYSSLALPPFVIYFLLIPIFLKRFEKCQIVSISLCLMAVSQIVIYFLGYDQNILIFNFILSAGVTLFAIPSTFMTPMILSDVVESVKYRYNMDASGVIFSLNTFAEKLAQAVASSLPLFILGFLGWKNIQAESFADLATAGIVQTELSLKGLWFVNSMLPAICITLSAIAIKI